MEEEAEDYFEKIEALGGVIPAIKANFFQKEIANASYKYQREIESKDRIIVGVNDFQLAESSATPLLKIDEEVAEEQIKILQSVRDQRNNDQVRDKLERLKQAATGTENLMPYIMDAIREYASIGEVMTTLKEVFGEYREDSIF
jgi:methylmalonyl-CoA mutase N-terminal domain/subunit